jgi:MFS superfamily sulfate permease-like transporter
MMFRDTLREVVEVVLLPAVMLRGAATQLGYLWITGYRPETQTVRHLQAAPACEMVHIEPWATYTVHLASTAVALCVPLTLYAMQAEMVGFPNPLVFVAWCYLALQWLFVLLWDPLVLALRGPEMPSDVGQEVTVA